MKYVVKMVGDAHVTAHVEIEASNAAEAVRIAHEDPSIAGDATWNYNGIEAIDESLAEAWPASGGLK
jgi:hypothetical protein